MRYLTINPEGRPPISGAILQAPVSDMESFEMTATPESRRWAGVAAQMVADGKGQDWMPKEASTSLGGDDGAVPFTAYRFASLFVAG